MLVFAGLGSLEFLGGQNWGDCGVVEGVLGDLDGRLTDSE